jgi:hypothetical protein
VARHGRDDGVTRPPAAAAALLPSLLPTPLSRLQPIPADLEPLLTAALRRASTGALAPLFDLTDRALAVPRLNELLGRVSYRLVLGADNAMRWTRAEAPGAPGADVDLAADVDVLAWAVSSGARPGRCMTCGTARLSGAVTAQGCCCGACGSARGYGAALA